MSRFSVLYFLLCAFAITTFFGCEAVFTDCGSDEATLDSVKISGCDDKQSTCHLHRDTNVSISIGFHPKKPVKKVSAVVHGVIAGVPVPFPLQKPDVCADSDSNIQCPLTQDTAYDYHASLFVMKQYPPLSLHVKWELQNENKEDIVCILIPVKIV